MPESIKKKIQDNKSNKNSTSDKAKGAVKTFAGLAIADKDSGMPELGTPQELLAD